MCVFLRVLQRSFDHRTCRILLKNKIKFSVVSLDFVCGRVRQEKIIVTKETRFAVKGSLNHTLFTVTGSPQRKL